MATNAFDVLMRAATPVCPSDDPLVTAVIYEAHLEHVDPEEPLWRVPYFGQIVRSGTTEENFKARKREHLGDAALQLASSEFLFHHFPEHQEGQLSLLRASLVNNPMICDVAATCGMHHCLRYNDDTMEEAGRARRGMLSDCFEAFLGALFLDRQPLGMAAVKVFCEKMLFSLSSVLISGRRWMDPKTRLNYCLNEFTLRQPTHLRLQRTFKVIEEWGPSHEKMFVVGCYLNGDLVASARGQSLADAQMGAARRATEELHLNDGLEMLTHTMEDSALQ